MFEESMTYNFSDRVRFSEHGYAWCTSGTGVEFCFLPFEVAYLIISRNKTLIDITDLLQYILIFYSYHNRYIYPLMLLHLDLL